MFIVLLTFSSARAQAGALMAAHNDWLQRGFDDGVFLLAGGIQPQAGGGILAHHVTRADLQARLDEDPFVINDVVRSDVFELSPSRTDDRLSFLLSPAQGK